MSAFRRLRAVLSVGLSWGIPWALAGIALVTWRVFLGSPRLAYPWHYWPRMLMTAGFTLGAVGSVAGIAFALAISRTANGRTVDELSTGYAARWGALAGLASAVALPLTGMVAWPVLLSAGALLAAIGAGSAGLTLAIARRPVSPSALLPREPVA